MASSSAMKLIACLCVLFAQYAAGVHQAPAYGLDQNVATGANTVNGVYPGGATQSVNYGTNTANAPGFSPSPKINEYNPPIYSPPVYQPPQRQHNPIYYQPQQQLYPPQYNYPIYHPQNHRYPNRQQYQPSYYAGGNPNLFQNAIKGSNLLNGAYPGDTVQNVQSGYNTVNARNLIQNALSGSNGLNGVYPGDTVQNVQYGKNNVNAEYQPHLYAGSHSGERNFVESGFKGQNLFQDASLGTLNGVYRDDAVYGQNLIGSGLPFVQRPSATHSSKVNQATNKGNNYIKKKAYAGENNDYNQATNIGSNELILTRFLPSGHKL